MSARAEKRDAKAAQTRTLADRDAQAAETLEEQILVVFRSRGWKTIDTEGHHFNRRQDGGLPPLLIPDVKALPGEWWTFRATGELLVSLVDIASQILEPDARGTAARQALHDRLQTVISGMEKRDKGTGRQGDRGTRGRGDRETGRPCIAHLRALETRLTMTNLPSARPPIRPLASAKETCRDYERLARRRTRQARLRRALQRLLRDCGAKLCILTTLLILAYFLTRIIGRI